MTNRRKHQILRFQEIGRGIINSIVPLSIMAVIVRGLYNPVITALVVMFIISWAMLIRDEILKKENPDEDHVRCIVASFITLLVLMAIAYASDRTAIPFLLVFGSLYLLWRILRRMYLVITWFYKGSYHDFDDAFKG